MVTLSESIDTGRCQDTGHNMNKRRDSGSSIGVNARQW